MDKNDLKRQRAEIMERRTKIAKERVDHLQTSINEKRGLTADEETKDKEFADGMAACDAELRSVDAKLASIEFDEPTETREADDGAPKPPKNKEEKRANDFFDTDEYRDIFVDFLKGKRSKGAVEKEVARLANDHQRALGRDAANQGAAVVPRNFMRKLVETLVGDFDFIGEIPMVTIDGDKKFAIELTTGGAAYRDPGDAYGGVDPTFDNLQVSIFDLGKMVQVDEELLDDSAIDLIGYLARNFGRVFGEHIEGQLVDGTANDAKGPASILVGVGNQNSANIGVVVWNDLIDLRAVPKSSARRGAKYVFNSTTEAALMKLQDGDGRPIWQPSFREGEPGRVNGQAYVLSDAMPDIANSAKPIAFGPWSRYCTNYIRRGMTMRRLNERFADVGRVGFRGQLRHDLVNELPAAFATLTIRAV